MQNSRETLQHAVDVIKNVEERKGMAITEKDMARKLDIPELQFYAYLHGEAPTPADLPFKLNAAYNIRSYMVEHSTSVHLPEPTLTKDGPARTASDRRSLKSIITLVKGIGTEKGMNITDEEIARKAGVSRQELDACLNGRRKVTNHLSTVLWSAYASLIDRHHMEAGRESLKHTVVLIRNCGLAAGSDITVKEMADAIDIPAEVLYAYISDENDLPLYDDLSSRLRSAYKSLLGNEIKVELREDINMIKSRKVAGE